MKPLFESLQNLRKFLLREFSLVTVLALVLPFVSTAQPKVVSQAGKKISPDLFGLFFEDINYSADGGLYAELVQNRSFEYNPSEQRTWHPMSFWEYVTPGYSYGHVSVETASPLNKNNPHYVVLHAEQIGHEANYSGETGVGIKNPGFDGIVVRSGETYNLSMFAKQLSENPVRIKIALQNRKGEILAQDSFTTSSIDWKKYQGKLVASQNYDTASLLVLATTPGKIAVDVVSLFPTKTFKGRANGLRPDLAQMLADMKPKFIRFPGGCLVHGDGLGNMYRWKNTIGPLEERKEQKNIWGYHQTTGLGYYEYFQFCEDVGAKPLPVLPAAVSCQNSGGTWRIGGTGQKAIPMEEMQEYIQDVLDLIEWANGSSTSVWGAKRVAAGHPAPFNLKYIGIGNEDKITPEFEERFALINNAIRSKHPEIIVVGTSGPFHSGEDFDKGWNVANKLQVPVIDEHYYTTPAWFVSNQYRYDAYNRQNSQVYLGEYASWGNKLINALSEGIYLTSLERNGDVVRMASYAPLFAKRNFTQWKTDMIFFDNTRICPTPNYYVQKFFSANAGDIYYNDIIVLNPADSTVSASCVQDSKTGDIILKLVNAGNESKTNRINLSRFKKILPQAEQTLLRGTADSENSFDDPAAIVPVVSSIVIKKSFDYELPGMSLTVLRIKTK